MIWVAVAGLALLALATLGVLGICGWLSRIAVALEARPPRQIPASDAVAARIAAMTAEEVAAFLVSFLHAEQRRQRPAGPGENVSLATGKVQ